MDTTVTHGTKTIACLAIARFEEDRDLCLRKHFGEYEYYFDVDKCHRFALRVFICHVENRKLHKRNACKFIQSSEITALKYLDAFEQCGLIEFVPDDEDRRKIRIIPTEIFLTRMRAYLSELIVLLQQAMQTIETAEVPLS